MLKKELRNGIIVLGTLFVPIAAQADQAMSTSQNTTQATYTPGEKIKTGQLPAGYNQSADYMCEGGWDVFLTADYIYWDWVQDTGLAFGATTSSSTVTSLANLTLTPNSVTPGYASGFQVGLGFNMHGMDDWNFYSEYTWYKNSDNQSASLTTTLPSSSASVSASGDVSLKYSNADFLLQRPFYFGKKLTANFYSGLKALWITNEYSAQLDRPGTFAAISPSFFSATMTSFSLYNKVSSWALGPKFGIDSTWLLGYGLKILTNISASVVYTRYTQSSNLAAVGTASILTNPVDLSSSISETVSNYGTIRPIAETFLGLGWGSFFCDNNFHFDLNIGYDFNVHWDYVTQPRSGLPSSNLYLHGLNVQARFDF